MNISEALEKDLVFIRDLENNNIKYMKEEKDKSEIKTMISIYIIKVVISEPVLISKLMEAGIFILK